MNSIRVTWNTLRRLPWLLLWTLPFSVFRRQILCNCRLPLQPWRLPEEWKPWALSLGLDIHARMLSIYESVWAASTESTTVSETPEIWGNVDTRNSRGATGLFEKRRNVLKGHTQIRMTRQDGRTDWKEVTFQLCRSLWGEWERRRNVPQTCFGDRSPGVEREVRELGDRDTEDAGRKEMEKWRAGESRSPKACRSARGVWTSFQSIRELWRIQSRGVTPSKFCFLTTSHSSALFLK